MSVSPLNHLTGSTIELLISCTGLADLDEFTKSDPMCVLFFKQFGQWKEFGRTEAIRDTLNPRFVESFMLEFDPALQQTLMFRVYDIDNRTTDLKHHDYVGSVEMTLTDLLDPTKNVCTSCKTLRVPGDPRARGIISITSEVVRESRDKVSLHVGGQKLGKTGKILSSKPNVYLEISRSIDNIAFHPVHRTETLYKTQNPRWRPFEVGLQRLCNGDWDRQLEFSVWRHRIDCQYSLMDYTRGGLKLNLTIAIDFTSSNGKPSEKLSLHDISSDKGNQYTDVIESLGTLILNCNREQKLALFGFGARVDNSNKVSHCFPLSNDWDNVHVNGIFSAINLYKNAVKKIRFAGPSKLKPMLAMAESMAVREPSQDSQAYHVLIIVTDGIINDFDDVMERLISISHLPLSVIFVGVGPADFYLMEMFSHHKVGLLTCQETKMCSTRKHTHFVSFRRDSQQSVGSDVQARDAFAVISAQVTEYMKNKNITPNKPSLLLTESLKSEELLQEFKEESDTVSMRSFGSERHNISRASSYGSLSRIMSCITGPKCPTCGSTLKPGTSLFSGITNIG
ncbi:nicotinic receptor-associated protein 1-like isoform X4 [Mercenaria mercenaria]|uniref:nicotinic receptor-associated protein 1-like isoform X4 n=1 Tax=Mercenaria mercenaria TaxID=6596 RepID=UPI00234ED07B|nr:nicotinic receptor-associated protein 1-like isoform X4 [Mercenaria mercenaria]